MAKGFYTMTKDEYLTALAELGLKPHSKATAKRLGVSLRQIGYYAAGEPIQEPIALLLGMYLRHGLPSADNAPASARAGP